MKSKLNADELNLMTLAQEYSDEDKARALLETMRWPDGPVCPHCRNHSDKPIYKLGANPTSKSPVRKGVYKCGACRKQFTVTIGTIFEDTHISIGKWLMAIFLLCASKKAMSAHQLHRMLKITYKSAWFMAHRIRYAMSPNLPLGKLLKGTVEVDETFIGGRGSSKTRFSRQIPVVALIERDGEMRTRVVESVSQKNLRQCLNECVDKSAVINTDDATAYRKPASEFKAHHVVNHSALEYALEMPDGSKAHVNSCESFFGLLKRGVYGSWHHVSKEHLPKYTGEFAFRWNNRKVTDGKRMANAVAATEGKRLTYRQAV